MYGLGVIQNLIVYARAEFLCQKSSPVQLSPGFPPRLTNLCNNFSHVFQLPQKWPNDFVFSTVLNDSAVGSSIKLPSLVMRVEVKPT